jgi:hypothetical protein
VTAREAGPRSLVALALMAGALACTRSPDRGDAAGRVALMVAARADAEGPPASAAAHVVGVSAGGGAVDAWYALPATPDGFGRTVTLPAGTYVLDARGHLASAAEPSAAAPDYQLSEAVTLAVGAQDHLAALVLDPAVAAVQATTNYPPAVTALLAAPITVDSGDPRAVVSLVGKASDRNGDLLRYRWAATYAPPLAAGAPPGQFTAPDAASTSWRPPAEYAGTVTFTFTASDPLGATSALSAAVKTSPTAAPGNAAFSATVNNFPDVSRLAATDAQLARGARTTLAVSARDADGDPLAYAWDDGPCNGTFANETSALPTYTAPADADGACTLTVIVTDLVKNVAPPVARGGATTSSVTINVGEPPARFAPVFTLAIQSPSGPVRELLPVYFQVRAEESDGLLTAPVAAFTWDDGTGRPAGFEELLAGDPSAVAWTPPACAGRTAPLELVVRATAAGSAIDPASGQPLTTTFSFPVTVSCP